MDVNFHYKQHLIATKKVGGEERDGGKEEGMGRREWGGGNGEEGGRSFVYIYSIVSSRVSRLNPEGFASLSGVLWF